MSDWINDYARELTIEEKANLLEACETLKSCDQKQAEILVVVLRGILGADEEIDRAFCDALFKRFYSGHGMPVFAMLWFVIGLNRRAKGEPWETCLLPEHDKNHKHQRTLDIWHAVEKARADNLPTSKDGEPGPAFANMAEKFGLSPSTVRDIYYKHKAIAELTHNLAIDMFKDS